MSLEFNSPLELWGGVECTVNRVGDRYFDQLERAGHAHRISDLDLIADAGIRTLRMPILWERCAPDGDLANIDWTWPDARLNHLRELGIRPIVGLVHHGSGPRNTDLLDPNFGEKLAEFARLVARRYPWVDAYTPVNEPLTTARFSGLYGHWYPHARDEKSFGAALLNQCRAVVLAMQAVRETNPAAQLVQTDDLGFTRSTPRLRYQADFENHRRWLSFDLLCGEVGRDHALYRYFRRIGWHDENFAFFHTPPCPPDVIGINYYLTSERFLDERLERYPAHWHGGNKRRRYADVPAVRVCAEGLAGARAILQESWNRYHRPVAVTEAHLGCTREEQMRWLHEVWQSARELRQSGADVRAVTAWSLFGAYDWNSLVTRDAGHYEPGAWDLRGGESGAPRATALVPLLRDLATGGESQHHVLEIPGWWNRAMRFDFASVADDDGGREICARESHSASMRQSRFEERTARPILIAGARGTLGQAFAHICETRGLPYFLATRALMDIADAHAVEKLVDEMQPWAIVNAAGYMRIDEAECEESRCHRENSDGAAVLAQACARRDLQLLTFSSELVFDGNARRPYVESDAPSPLGVLGRSKAEAEARVREILPSALIARAGAFFGLWDNSSLLTQGLRALAANRNFTLPGDSLISPTFVPDLVNAGLDLLLDGERGIWHLTNGEATTWPEFLERAALRCNIDGGHIEARPLWAMNLAAPRPQNGALNSERGQMLPRLDDAMDRYAAHCEALILLMRQGEAMKNAA